MHWNEAYEYMRSGGAVRNRFMYEGENMTVTTPPASMRGIYPVEFILSREGYSSQIIKGYDAPTFWYTINWEVA